MWIRFSDLRRLKEKIGEGKFPAFVKRLGQKNKERVALTWDKNLNLPPTSFWNIPQIMKHWNRRISGSPDISHRQYLAGKHLTGSHGMLALSLGCGAGANELDWCRLGPFARIDACDLSPARIQAARDAAVRSGLDSIIHFFVADAHQMSLPENQYDLVLAEGALHHLAPLKPIMERIRRWLKPGGLLVALDFVGPTRLQWTRRQVRLANALLALLPERLRRTWHGRIKRRVDRPGSLRMRIVDPSEAKESKKIRPLLRSRFEMLEEIDMGGTLLNLVFHGIAHHFCGDDPEAAGYLDLILETEARLLASGEIGSDFILSVCRKPKGHESSGADQSALLH